MLLFNLLLQLPKATDTSAFSGAGFLRLVKNVGDSISKIGGKKSDTDRVSLLLLRSPQNELVMSLCVSCTVV